MSKMSFLEKIDILFKLSKSSYIYLLVILILLIFGIIFSTTNRRTIKRNKKIYIGFSVFIFSSLILIFHKSLSQIFDYMMNNFFIAILFPNLAIYMAALIITNIIVWISIFSFKTSEAIKRLNCIIYMIINYLLFLILSIINDKKLDIFTQSSVYGNKNATALIELSSTIFIIWIIFLILYKIILIYIKKDYEPKVKKVVVKKKVKKLPNNYEPTEVPALLYGKIPQKKNHPNQLTLEQQELITKAIIKERTLKKEYEDSLTLDDYKRILKILKQKKYIYDIEKENKETRPIIISREEMNYRNKQKEEIIRLEEERKKLLHQEKLKLEQAKQQLEEEQLKENLTELERLYKGIQ